MRKYIANIAPLNAEKIGTSAHGTAEFTIDGDTPTTIRKPPLTALMML